jgi:hypothetical protein
MKYTIFIVVWLLLGNQHVQAQDVDLNKGQPIEMKGRKFSKGTATDIKFGFTMKRIGPYLEGAQAQNTYAEARQMIRKGNVTTIASTALFAVALPFASASVPRLLAMQLSSITGVLPFYYYIKGGQLVQQAISEHNAFVGEETPTMNSSFK